MLGVGRSLSLLWRQLLGFQDVFTPVVHGTRAPIFHHTTSFPVATDEKLLRFLARYVGAVSRSDPRQNTMFKVNGMISYGNRLR